MTYDEVGREMSTVTTNSGTGGLTDTITYTRDVTGEVVSMSTQVGTATPTVVDYSYTPAGTGCSGRKPHHGNHHNLRPHLRTSADRSGRSFRRGHDLHNEHVYDPEHNGLDYRADVRGLDRRGQLRKSANRRVPWCCGI